jgi:hypothetical protein
MRVIFEKQEYRHRMGLSNMHNLSNMGVIKEEATVVREVSESQDTHYLSKPRNPSNP